MVVLDNDVSIHHSGKEGVYNLASDLLQIPSVQSKPCWIKEDQKHAIWFDPESNSSWNIGAMTNIGTSTYDISAIDCTSIPCEAVNWEYQKGRNWIHTTDVKVQGTKFQMNSIMNISK